MYIYIDMFLNMKHFLDLGTNVQYISTALQIRTTKQKNKQLKSIHDFCGFPPSVWWLLAL